MIGLMAIAGGVLAAGVELPETDFAELGVDASLIALAVLFAPLTEEFAFRGWITGRPAMIWALITLVVGGALVGVLLATDQASSLVFLAAFGTFIGAVGVLFFRWSQPPFGWTPRLFPWLFWASTAAFALVHLANYSEGSILALLPLVLPQFIGGTIFGYTRVHYGLWASILAHALHNGAVIALVLSASP